MFVAEEMISQDKPASCTLKTVVDTLEYCSKVEIRTHVEADMREHGVWNLHQHNLKNQQKRVDISEALNQELTEFAEMKVVELGIETVYSQL